MDKIIHFSTVRLEKERGICFFIIAGASERASKRTFGFRYPRSSFDLIWFEFFFLGRGPGEGGGIQRIEAGRAQSRLSFFSPQGGRGEEKAEKAKAEEQEDAAN